MCIEEMNPEAKIRGFCITKLADSIYFHVGVEDLPERDKRDWSTAEEYIDKNYNIVDHVCMSIQNSRDIVPREMTYYEFEERFGGYIWDEAFLKIKDFLPCPPYKK